ncbi:uncharacterized protein B0I36DRAFT_337501 [Microdochium trichocladiopsis]|uniref:Polycomb protein VEFS-Box domain-containing protein n=1 Tax=Microdochium trichocladiopsis TaxID=1682393 RepID=A0A9P8XWE6_9PEZI|nr:uncharacterized protein B0I36DRAFT_337501 [Microdochium trichocladiopsis]KAH7016370.1 hypothetical protein B0I36DRAFT_337501 [Microdochium trichocladiopsis]
MARIYLTKPFHIPAEKIYVLREDDDLFTLEDSYFISVELESAGDPNWPPQALLAKEQRDDAKDAGKRWVLSAQTTYQFDKHRTTAPVKLRRKVGFEADAGLDLDIDLRWPTNHAGAPLRARPVESPSEVKAAASGALETLTSGQLNQSAETENIIRAGDGHEPPPDEDFDETGEAVTPTRALRQKKKQIYNLKALSDKARGKGLKERKQQVKATESGLEAGRVTWVLPQLGQVTTADFGCIRCYATHPSQALLLQHTEDHPEFKFRLDLSGKHGMRILISQHGQPTPEPEDAESEPAREMTPRKQPKPRVSHQKQRLLPVKPKDPRQLIPDNKQPLYNRVTKATLAPGALIEPPPVDDSWLMQKHRDVILDYSDVHAEEKEYICEWDAFVLKQRITSEPHLQNVYLSFIEEKASWLTSRQSRMIEFAKHLTYLKARNSLTQETIIKAFAMLRDAKADAEEVSSEEPKPASPRVEGRRSASGCGVCGQPVRGPSTLICDNEVRFYIEVWCAAWLTDIAGLRSTLLPRRLYPLGGENACKQSPMAVVRTKRHISSTMGQDKASEGDEYDARYTTHRRAGYASTRSRPWKLTSWHAYGLNGEAGVA